MTGLFGGDQSGAGFFDVHDALNHAFCCRYTMTDLISVRPSHSQHICSSGMVA